MTSFWNDTLGYIALAACVAWFFVAVWCAVNDGKAAPRGGGGKE